MKHCGAANHFRKEKMFRVVSLMKHFTFQRKIRSNFMVSARLMEAYATCPVEVSVAVKVAVTKFERPEMLKKLEGVCF